MSGTSFVRLNATRFWLLLLPCILGAALAAPSACLQAAPLELGVDRSNLINEDESVRQSTLQGIAALHATWFRDAANASTSFPKGRANLVDEFTRAKALHLKVLLTIFPLDSDFADNNANAPRNKCGWSERKFSTVSLPKLVERLEATLGALKAANVEVDAFEIGNEDDTNCYNADIPNGHAASEAELHTAVLGYAHFLQSAAEVIKRPAFYPRAKLITFGIAHGSDQHDNPPHHLSRPARFVAMLRNLDGFNYLDNSRYHIDGYGTHIYAVPHDIAQSIRERLQEDASILGRDKPFWITEWGFLNKKAFPNKKGQTLEDGIRECLATFEEIQRTIPLGPIMFYSYNNWLVDDGDRPQPALGVLRSYANQR